MGTYFTKERGWRYDFIIKGERCTGAWFKTKKDAKQAESERRDAIKNPKPAIMIPIDMVFLELMNRRLDHLQAYNSAKHYKDHIYMGKRWLKKWKDMMCGDISQDMIQNIILERKRVSAYTANMELRYLRALFNFGKKKVYITKNPTDGIEFLPVEKKKKYIPSLEDINKVIDSADQETKDYLWTIRDTIARVGEINQLKWDDIDFNDGSLILHTRKKKGGSLTPRSVPMTPRLYEILYRRYLVRDKSIPWVFWHTYKSRKNDKVMKGPYGDRKRIMRSLCKKAEVRYFRFHALRHAGASVMDNINVPISSIQKFLGHENRSTTEIYIHSFGSAERIAMAQFEKATPFSHTDSHTDKNIGDSQMTNPLN